MYNTEDILILPSQLLYPHLKRSMSGEKGVVRGFKYIYLKFRDNQTPTMLSQERSLFYTR